MNMTKTGFGIALTAALAFTTGCVSFTGATGPGDDLSDDGNMQFAAVARKQYEQRQQFRRQVSIAESPAVNLFLDPTKIAGVAHPAAMFWAQWNAPLAEAIARRDPVAMCQNLELRKALLILAKSKVRESVGGLRDLQLVDNDTGAQVTVTVSTATPTASNVYRMTYNISNIEVRENAAGNVGKDLMSIGIASLDDKHKPRTGHAIAGVAQQYTVWQGKANVEIGMTDPQGRVVFTFNGEGKSIITTSDGPTKELVEDAVADAVKNAFAQYAVKFGPPVYVTETCQDGQFAQLSVGADYGFTAGQRVEFYRNVERKVPTLPGEPAKVEYSQRRVGTGVIGAAKAPISGANAWVKVDDYDPEHRSVFRFTSARLFGGK